MMITNNKREKLKELLLKLSPEETGDVKYAAILQKQGKKVLSALEAIDEIQQNHAQRMDGMTQEVKSNHRKLNQSIQEAFRELTDTLVQEIKNLNTTVKTSTPKFPDQSGFFKDLGTQLTGIGVSSKQTSELIRNLKWNSSMQLRNKNGSPIDPASEQVANTVGTGTKTVTTAGTAVQVSTTSTPCYSVYIQCHETNTGAVAVGDSSVVAATSGRRGIILYPTQSQRFLVNNLNLLYVDAVNSGDKINYYYEAS